LAVLLFVLAGCEVVEAGVASGGVVSGEPYTLSAPISLYSLRRAGNFRPPQSLAYVRHDQRERLIAALQ